MSPDHSAEEELSTQGTDMKESSGVSLVWKGWLLVCVCVLLLLSCAGLVFLLVRQRELTQELLRLDAQVQELSQSCRVLPLEPAEAGQLKKLHRSRRNLEGEATESQDDKDVLTLMTYSMVPVRHLHALMWPLHI